MKTTFVCVNIVFPLRLSTFEETMKRHVHHNLNTHRNIWREKSQPKQSGGKSRVEPRAFSWLRRLGTKVRRRLYNREDRLLDTREHGNLHLRSLRRETNTLHILQALHPRGGCRRCTGVVIVMTPEHLYRVVQEIDV